MIETIIALGEALSERTVSNGGFGPSSSSLVLSGPTSADLRGIPVRRWMVEVRPTFTTKAEPVGVVFATADGRILEWFTGDRLAAAGATLALLIGGPKDER